MLLVNLIVTVTDQSSHVTETVATNRNVLVAKSQVGQILLKFLTV